MISILSTLRIALRALWVNKMRSSLTMLGIIIGVSAVITMLAVGTGASQKISEQISSIGSNLLIVVPGSSTQGGIRMGGGSQSTLTKDDADAISQGVFRRFHGGPHAQRRRPGGVRQSELVYKHPGDNSGNSGGQGLRPHGGKKHDRSGRPQRNKSLSSWDRPSSTISSAA